MLTNNDHTSSNQPIAHNNTTLMWSRIYYNLSLQWNTTTACTDVITNDMLTLQTLPHCHVSSMSAAA